MDKRIYFHALGTDNHIYLPQYDKENIALSAENRVLQLDKRLSIFNAESEISQINQYAGKEPVWVSSDTFTLLRRAVWWSERTNGAFDITLGPLIKLWRKAKLEKIPPKQSAINECLRLVDYRDLILDEKNSTAMLKRCGQCIDLGGIAKGFAADQVKKLLLENEVRSALINLGGNIAAIGSKPDGSPWKLGIQKPFAPVGEYIGLTEIVDATVVTSGLYENYFYHGNRLYHHIIDSHTGWPCESGLLSVTAIGKSSMDMDALTTAIYALGMEKGLELLKAEGSKGVFITSQKQVYTTEDMDEKFKLIKKRK